MYLELETWDPTRDFDTIVPDYNAELSYLADAWWRAEFASKADAEDPTHSDVRFELARRMLSRPRDPQARERRYVLACQQAWGWAGPLAVPYPNTYADLLECNRKEQRKIITSNEYASVILAAVDPAAAPGFCGRVAARLYLAPRFQSAARAILDAWLEI